MEEMVAEIVHEMDYMRTREQKLRDTNESTNTRVKWFAFATMGMLVSLGAWQIVYLRAYFRLVLRCVSVSRAVLIYVLGRNILFEMSMHRKRGVPGDLSVSFMIKNGRRCKT
jgi:hypothetical protein